MCPCHCSIAQFSQMYSKKLEVDPADLQKSLWGDFYYNGKTKKIMTGAQVNIKHKGIHLKSQT